jgi:hypothetical protein
MFNIRGFILVFILSAVSSNAFAAVGCDLNDPDRDVSRLFPSSTGYKTRYLSIKTSGGDKLLARVEERLGDKFRGLYENIEVPYTLYDIFRGTETLGYIHGVNQKGEYGGIQVFLALDTRGTIKGFYMQKLTSRAAKELRSKEFGAQFEGLSLKDFSAYNPVTGFPGVQTTHDSPLHSPDDRAGADFRHVMRAVKKNLILMDEFVFSKRGK